jgi:hypothetical protein
MALVTMFAIGWIIGLGTYWAWVIVDWRLTRRKRFYE